MIVLGIESTAHTFGIGICRDDTILANEKDMYKPPKGGILPRQAAEHHMELAQQILQRALGAAKIKIDDIDAVAFSQGPGLPPCLKIGAFFARYLAQKLGKPLYGVNHCVAHVEIGKLHAQFADPITLYVSGGNTQVLGFASGKYSVFGETQDVGVGNALDAFAREAGIGFPGGPVIEQLALKSKNYVKLPYTVKGMDTAFSGIQTEALKFWRRGEKLEDICFSLQETYFAMLVETVERALSHTEKDEVLLVGGVAANKRLQEMLRIMCSERDAKFHCVERQYSMDNGAMIAFAGYLGAKNGQPALALEESRINQKWRTDQTDVYWITD